MRQFLIFLLYAFLTPAFALTTVPTYTANIGSFQSGTVFYSGQAACSAAYTKFFNNFNGAYGAGTRVEQTGFGTNTVGSDCSARAGSASTWHAVSSGQVSAGVLSCPVNSTLTSPGVCTCSSGFIENSTQTACESLFELQKQVCENTQTYFNSTLGERYTDVEMSGEFSSDTSVCVPTSFSTPESGPVSCTMNFELEIGFLDAAGDRVSRGRLDMGGMVSNYTSLPCGESPTIPQVDQDDLNPPCPSGQQMGEINGVATCKPYGPDVTATTKDSTETKTGPNGTVTTEKVTSCTGNTCTTTSTSSDGTSDSVTTSKANFCLKNEMSGQCGGSGDGGGGGGGDDGGCKAGSKEIGCAEFGETPEAEETGNTDVAVTFARESGFGASNGTCPAPRTFQIYGGQTISMSFDMYCTFASGIRPLVIAFALLSAAGMVVFGATRKG